MIAGQLIRIDNGQVFIEFIAKVTNSDGSVSFQQANGQYGGQEPGIYGKINENNGIEQYQRAEQTGIHTIVFKPEANYPGYLYILVEGIVYPA